MIEIKEVGNTTLAIAAKIHSLAWQQSHADFCSKNFVEAHTPERQKQYLVKEIEDGKKLFMLFDEDAKGIVTLKENLIENLYVKPDEQNKGYGTKLLEFAVAQCKGKPTLWTLGNNRRAIALYEKKGFVKSGKSHLLSDKLSELEMVMPKK